ncbi:PaaI family thioesterase [Cumulibacter manganitolerans]|uniref:PaaI family thioesterase n=1 Tax=Cumulibacter manganitolerans TaxID=1884992 RepID=UPI0012971653|nr:PaaI family thioesterase [Cumulibacter manganitolerans]
MSDGFVPVTVEVEDPEGLREKERAHEALADAVRELLDATIRTRVDVADLDALTAEVRAVGRRLLADAHDGPVGLQVSSDGRLRDPGNPAVGRRNAFAPPLRMERDKAAKRVTCRFNLGAAYEGPPRHVHGGVLALVLDQVLGSVPPLAGRPGMTASLEVSYRRPSPLQQDLTAEAWLERVAGWRTYVRGQVLDAEGRVTVEASGLFIVPRFARDALSVPMSDAADYDPTDTDPRAGA